MSERTDTAGVTKQTEQAAEGNPETPVEMVDRALRDGVIGAIAGLIGNVAVLGTLLVATALGGFSLEVFTRFPTLLGLEAILGSQQLLAVGVGTFVLGGMVVWPLLLATLGVYLPGETYAVQGLFFGFITWTGFVGYFNPGVSGVSLGIYLVFSLIGHFGYGIVMGTTMERLFSDRKPLVSTALAPQSNRPVAATAGNEPSEKTDPEENTDS